MKRWAYILVGLLLALLVSYWAFGWYRGPIVEVAAQRVTRRTIRSYIDEQGVTSINDRYEITMPYDGRIERIELEEGDRVSAGQPVVRLVAEDLRLEVAAAQAAIH